tara:strand:+ start:1285 stop:5589 length:4305 start_codon:yes stop_codon:yes gene_type:complete
MGQRIFYTELQVSELSGDTITLPADQVQRLKVGHKIRVHQLPDPIVPGGGYTDIQNGDYQITEVGALNTALVGGSTGTAQILGTQLDSEGRRTRVRLNGVGTGTQFTQQGLQTVTFLHVQNAANSLGKQIKIGFDKVPAPVTKQFQQLVDIEGTLLFDDANNPLVTEESAALSSRTVSRNALSIQVNNTPDRPGGGAVKIVEQFKEFSEVSSSLLGVPRAEEQLSLFSDVATYGLDVDNWDASDLDQTHNNYPEAWYRKEHPIHGRRSNVSFYEGSDEQALYLKAFPSQYTFPYGTKYEKRANAKPSFIKYMKFIAIGRYLYDYWLQRGYKSFAEANFLAPRFVELIDDSDNLVPFYENTFQRYYFLRGSSQTSLEFPTSGTWFDVDYLGDEQESYDAIERWTAFYDRIRQSIDKYPVLTTTENSDVTAVEPEWEDGDTYKDFREYSLIRSAILNEDVIPGASTNAAYYGILQSKRTFRYQPGRVSGFTFGVRMQSDGSPASSTVAEWGCSNDTDEYMFQLKGSAFSIVRRSTIPLPDSWFAREGISTDDQTIVSIPGVRNIQREDYDSGTLRPGQLYETRIRRDDFNGDKLQGGGLSGYNLKFEDVTMYKIEFSWYGAIGAKFYAYVPVGNGDARWVLIHTLVIENSIEQPVLENPDFRMKYLLHTNSTKEIRAPIFLYKYGSSVYIDGGDEGTIRFSSQTVDTKTFTNRTPIIGIMPKNEIKNSEGVARANFKKIYPSTVTVTSDTNTRLDFEEVIGSSSGIHFHYSPSIHMPGRHPKSRVLPLSYTGIGPTGGRTKFGVNPVNSGSKKIRRNDNNEVIDSGSAMFKTSVTDGSARLTLVNDIDSVQHDFNNVQVGDQLSLPVALSDTTIKHFIDGNGDPVYNGTGAVALDFVEPVDIAMASSGTQVVSTINGVIYQFNEDEHKAHIIADGVYGSYVDQTNSNILKRVNDENYTLEESTSTDSRKIDGSIRTATSTSVFDAYVVGKRTIVASTTPIQTNNFKIHFLNPVSKDPAFSNYHHWSEFSVGVTSYLPTESGDTANRPTEKVDNPEVLFRTGSGSDYDCVEYDPEDFPSVEFSHRDVAYDFRNEVDAYEQDSGTGIKLQIDPRLDEPEEKTTGLDSGRVSTIVGELSVIDIPFSSVSSRVISSTRYTKLNFGPSDEFVKPDIVFKTTSEIGLNFQGLGVNIVNLTDNEKDPFFEEESLGDGGNMVSETFLLVEYDAPSYQTLATLSGDEQKIQLKKLTLKDDWQAFAVDDDGDERYQNKQFALSHTVSFNVLPLYPVFALADHSKINGIVIEEILEKGSVRTFNPTFVKESHPGHPVQIVTNGNADGLSYNIGSGGFPSAFNNSADDDLSAARFDIYTTNQLRPGVCLFSTYVGENETISLNLSNIFGRDRKGVTRGSLNNKALYITATALDGGTGNIQMSVTNKEQ